MRADHRRYNDCCPQDAYSTTASPGKCQLLDLLQKLQPKPCFCGMLMLLPNYSLSINKLEVKYWDKNLDHQRSSGEAVRDLHPKGLRSSHGSALLLPVSICPQSSKTSMVDFGHLVPSSVLWIKASFFVRMQSKHHTTGCCNHRNFYQFLLDC